jgi:hypothetical protein
MLILGASLTEISGTFNIELGCGRGRGALPLEFPVEKGVCPNAFVQDSILAKSLWNTPKLLHVFIVLFRESGFNEK